MPENKFLKTLFLNYPELSILESDMVQAFDILCNCFEKDGKLLLCGNGGSAADCDHIVGELMKGFLLKRPVPEELTLNPQVQTEALLLQRGLQAIALTAQSALATAIQNDIGEQMVYAQQVYGYGKAGDVVLSISTSGNSENILHAVRVAKALGLHTIGLTGEIGGKMADWCDVTIKVPARETYRIQEYHLPVYHCLCAMVEDSFFG